MVTSSPNIHFKNKAARQDWLWAHGLIDWINNGGGGSNNIELRKTDEFIQWKLTSDTEWTNLVALADLEGPAGPQGLPGPSGKSAYELWLLNGGVGSYEDYKASNKGDKGEDGAPGADGAPGTPGTNGVDGAPGATGPRGETGPAGAPGTNGTNGADGAPGVSLVNRGAWVSGTTYSPSDYVFAPSTTDPLVNSMWITQGSSPFVSTVSPKDDPTKWIEFKAPKGEKGDTGTPGTNGKDGAPGADGSPGPRGEQGPPGRDGTAADQIQTDWKATSGKGQLLNKPSVISNLIVEYSTLKSVDDKGVKKQVAEIEDFIPVDSKPSNRLILGGQGLLVNPPFPLNGRNGDVLTYQTGEPFEFKRVKVVETGQSLSGMAGNDTIVVTCSRGGNAYWSNDGYVWTKIDDSQFGGNTANLSKIVWAVDRFVMVSDLKSWHSFDGKNWVEGGAFPQAVSAYNMAYARGRIVVTGGGSTSVLASNDFGASWHVHNTPSNTYWALATAKDRWYLGGSNKIMVSEDLDNWTTINLPGGGNVYGIAFGHGQFIAVASAGIIYKSRDGLNWTRVANDPASQGAIGSMLRVFITRNSYVVSGQAGGGNPGIWYSHDTDNWAILSDGNTAPYGFSSSVTHAGLLLFGDGSYVNVSVDGMGTTWVTDTTRPKKVVGSLVKTGDTIEVDCDGVILRWTYVNTIAARGTVRVSSGTEQVSFRKIANYDTSGLDGYYNDKLQLTTNQFIFDDTAYTQSQEFGKIVFTRASGDTWTVDYFFTGNGKTCSIRYGKW